MQIGVIGTGYVGLVAGACFADTGNEVTCVDIDPSKIESLKAGKIPIYEPGLEELVVRGHKEGRLHFTTSTEDAVRSSEVLFLAVQTPPLANGDPDLKYLKAASEAIARAMNGPKIIVNKSTVPIGSHEVVAEWMRPHTKHAFEVVSNPEFLKEGSAVDDFLKPDRVVIGAKTDAAFQKMADLYMPFLRQGNPILRMDPVSAEITKYACNSFLATRISFMNELSRLCENVGGDIEEVRKGMSTDVRIGKHFLYAGVGYGGSCFPKDVQALMATGRKRDVPLRIIEAAELANAQQKRRLVERVKERFGNDLKGRQFTLWGLAFKPNTDDMREAPALTIIEELVAAGAKICAYDPVSMPNTKKILENRINYSANALDALNGSDALLLVTEWNEFRHIDLAKIKAKLKSPVLFDGRNLYNPKQVRDAGFEYCGIGRP